MTPDLAVLRDLLQRVESATGADRKLDERIGGIEDAFTLPLPLYTASIDAAVALIERMLPGERASLDFGGDEPCAALVKYPGVFSLAATPPLALLAALLRALIAQGETGT